MTHVLGVAAVAALTLAPACGIAGTTATTSPGTPARTSVVATTPPLLGATLRTSQAAAEALSAGVLETIEPATTDPGWRPVLVTDRFGTTTAVWDRTAGGRFTAQRTPSGTWSPPVSLGCTSPFTCGSVVLGVDRTGTVTAAWDENTGRPRVHVLTKSVAGAWSQPVTLTGPTGRPNGFEPRLDVAPNGSAVIGYQLPAGGVVVVRKPADRTWTQARVRKFSDMDISNGVAIGRDGRVVVVGDRQVRGGQSAVMVHVFRPGVGWLAPRELGREGGFTQLAFLDMGRTGSTAVAWTVGTKDFRYSAVAVRRMSTHYRWDRTKVISPWFGQSHAAFVSSVAVGPRATVTVIWSGRTYKASTRLPSGVWVRRQPVPTGATLQFAGYSTNAAGDAAVPWYTTNVVDGSLASENLFISIRDHPSLTWRRSETLGTSSCGTGERGDPGCRPFAVSTLPDGSTLVSWFDLTNALVARLVH